MKIYKVAITSIVFVAIVFLGFTTAYTIVIWRNITTTFLDWNPPPLENAIPIRVAYPDTMVIVAGNTSDTTIFTITMLLKFNGTLAENTQIKTENATGLIYPTQSGLVQTRDPHILTISIGFKQATYWQLKNDIQQGNKLPESFGFACAMFWHGYKPLNESYFDPPNTYDVYFPVAGDYSPTVFIAYENQTVEYTYSSIQLHVLSASEVNGERINRINLGLTFAFLGFSYIGVIALLYELLKKDKDYSQFPINVIITPENKNTMPTKNKPKIISFSNSRPDSEGSPNADNSDKSNTHKPKKESTTPK